MNTQELCDAVLNNGFNATAELYDSDPAGDGYHTVPHTGMGTVCELCDGTGVKR